MKDGPIATDEVVRSMERECQDLLAAFDALGSEAATVTATSDGWTAKDTLAHLIHYAGQVAWALGAKLQPPAYVLANAQRRPSGDEWNALAVAHFRPQSGSAVRAEFLLNTSALLERTRLLTDDQVNASAKLVVPWAVEGSLGQFVASDTYLHWALHAQALRDAATPA